MVIYWHDPRIFSFIYPSGIFYYIRNKNVFIDESDCIAWRNTLWMCNLQRIRTTNEWGKKRIINSFWWVKFPYTGGRRSFNLIKHNIILYSYSRNLWSLSVIIIKIYYFVFYFGERHQFCLWYEIYYICRRVNA